MAEGHDETLGGAAGFEELAEFDLPDLEAAGLEVLRELVADGVEDEGAANVDGVAGEADGIGLVDNDALRRWVEGFDTGEGAGVEGGREVHCGAVGEWGEAGIEVVEAGINQPERNEVDIPGGGKQTVTGGGSTWAVADPEAGLTGGEQGVALAFEGGVAREIDGVVTVILEPATEVMFFGLALGMEEAADGHGAIEFEAGVGSEDHVGGAWLGGDQEDVGESGDFGVEGLPLGGGALARGGVEVAGHPWIDDVVDLIERWGTHEKGGAGARCA